MQEKFSKSYTKISAQLTFKRFITAGGDARIFNWLTNSTFAILTSERFDISAKENSHNLSKLKQHLIKEKFGFYPAAGFYAGASESSLFVPKLPLEKACELGKKYNQEIILWGENGKYGFYNPVTKKLVAEKQDVKDNFSILNDSEIKKMHQEKSPIGYTKIKRSRLPFSLDTSINDLRKTLEDDYVVITDQRTVAAMGNFQKIVTAKSIEADGITYGDNYFLSFGSLLAVVPLSLLEYF